MKNNEYQCALCGGVFEKGQSDEEAEAEGKENFPGTPEDEIELICDYCYKLEMN